jgi:hypothetical protein
LLNFPQKSYGHANPCLDPPRAWVSLKLVCRYGSPLRLRFPCEPQGLCSITVKSFDFPSSSSRGFRKYLERQSYKFDFCFLLKTSHLPDKSVCTNRCLVEEKRERRKWKACHFCLFEIKVATQGVSLWYFHIYIYIYIL